MAESFDNNDLDRVIDDVAREMTAGEPNSAFNAHVLARIERGDRMRRSWRAAWILAPLAAAAAIAIVAAILWRPVRDRRPEPSGTQTVRLKPDTTTESREPRTEN